ncbi:hypothetical protein ACP70R_008832 [Stipagrostis hirtigluma subsp. patula]
MDRMHRRIQLTRVKLPSSLGWLVPWSAPADPWMHLTEAADAFW